jgi:HEAT repeat protein
MIPLPKYFCRVITSPFKTFFQKHYPTKKSEILIVLTFYFVLTILITALLNTFAVMQSPGKWVFIEKDSRSINELKKDFINTPERRDKDKLLKLLIAKGDSAAPLFIDLLNSNNLVIREFSADALGILTPRNAVIPLIKALDDNSWRVQSSVINALGNYNSKEVTKSLIDLLNKNNTGIRNASAMALSKNCNNTSQKILIKKLSEDLINPTNTILLCIAKSKSAEAVNELIKFSSDENIKIRQTSAIGLMLTKSKGALPSLEKLLSDKDWEVRLYAEEAIHEIMKN